MQRGAQPSRVMIGFDGPAACNDDLIQPSWNFGMADQWFYRIFGEDFGPVPFEKLREMADQGTVGAGDEVRSANSNRWMTAGSVNGLGLSSLDGGTAVATASDSDTATDVSTNRAGLDDWYCMVHGHEMGPLSFEELVKFAEHDNVSADDEVKLGANGKWRRAGSIGRLVAVLPYRAVERKAPIPATKNEMAIRTESPKRVVPCPVKAEPAPVELKPVVALLETRPAPVSSSMSGGYSSMSSSSSRSYSTPRSAAASIRPAPKPTPSRRSSSSSSSLSESLEFLKNPQALGAMGVLALLLLFVGWQYLPQNSAADVKRFHELKHIVDEIKVKRSGNSTDFAALATQAERVSKAITADLAKKASRDNPVKLSLLWAARDELPRVLSELKKAPAAPGKAEDNFVARLRDAAQQLGLKDWGGLPAPPPAPEIAANVPKPGFPND